MAEDAVSAGIQYSMIWIGQQFTTLQNNFSRLQTCCLQAGLNFTSIMSEPDFPDSGEELIKELLFDAVCTLPGLVFLANLHALEEKKLVHQVALAAERLGKLMETVNSASEKSAQAYAGGADQIRTAALKKVMNAILADLDAAKNRVATKQRRMTLLIMENRDKLPHDFKQQVLTRVVRIDELSKYQAQEATKAYEERIFRFWAKQRVKVVKTVTDQQGYGDFTRYSLEGHKFNEKQLEYIKENFEVQLSNMHEKWGVKLEERQRWQSSRGMH
jgi:hypothetical protein